MINGNHTATVQAVPVSMKFRARRQDDEAQGKEHVRLRVVENQYRISEAAELLRVSMRTIHNWIAAGVRTRGSRGIYPVYRLTRNCVRIPASSIQALLDRSVRKTPFTVQAEHGVV